MTTGGLAAAARDHWTRHGWTRLPGFLPASTVEDLARWTAEIAAWPEEPGKWMRYYERGAGESGKMLARIENFVPYHAGLAALFASPRLLDLLADCCGEPVVLFKDKINFKLPGGAGFADHQDAPAYVNFGIEHHLTVMVPVDPFTRENGCLEMALDASARVFLPHKADGTLEPGVMAGLAVEPVLADPGDVIVFDAWVPHRSGPNRSPRPRRSYYLTYNPASAGDHRADYYRQKRACFPPEYERQPGVDYARLGAQFNLGNPFD
jgi:hypothetical protein